MPWPLDASRSAERFARVQASLAERYRVERELDPAGPACVYLARDLAADRSVAIKLLDPSRTAAVGTARLLRELRVAQRIEHRHLLPLLDAGVVPTEAGEAVYYTVPLLPGEPLHDRLERDAQLPVAEALAIAEDVSAALAACHAQGLAHGEVGPGTIYLSGGEALLADLGIAFALAEPRPDGAGDIRDLGRVLYRMLAGAPVPEGDAPPLRSVRDGVPEEVELTVAQMLAPPHQRYRTAEEARAALRNAAASAGPVPAAGATSAERATLKRPVPARWTVFTLAVLGLLGLSLWFRFTAPAVTSPPPPPMRPGSLSVLPFANITPDTGYRYLSDGLTRELTRTLGGVPGLRVTGAASAFLLGGRRMEPRQAGERLGVDAVLLGTIRPFEGRLRVRAHLVSVREGFDLWSETYERDASELQAVQREIVQAVAGVLRLGGAVAPGAPADPGAHAAYLRGVAGLERGDAAGGLQHLEQAVRLDSTFARAWTALARARLQAGAHDSITPDSVATLARTAAERAMALDSSLPEVHAALAAVLFRYDWNWPAAETSFRRALALNPSLPESHLGLAHLLLAVGRVDEALEAGRRALELSPFDPSVRIRLGWQALQIGDYLRAEEEVRQATAVAPAAGAALLRGVTAGVTGRYDEARAVLEPAAADSSAGDEARALLGWVHALAGRREEAREIQAGLQAAAEVRYVSPYLLAILADGLGDRRAAFASLERAVAARDPALVDLRIDPRMDRLRVDRRFDAVARRLGLP